jgi:hypothetical protein
MFLLLIETFNINISQLTRVLALKSLHATVLEEILETPSF